VRKILLVLFVSLLCSQSAAASFPVGEVKPMLTIYDVPGDFNLSFGEYRSGGSYKPFISGILELEEKYTTYTSVLPNCLEDLESPCLKSFEISNDDGKTWVKYKKSTSYESKIFDKNLNLPKGSYSQVSKNWPANSLEKLPAGANTSVFEFEDLNHFGGNQFMVQAVIEGVSSKDDLMSKSEKLSLIILPISVYSAPSPNTCSIWKDYCFKVYNFPENFKFRLSLDLKYLSSDFSGWFQSRIKEGIISQFGGSEISFEGYAVQVSHALASFYKPFPETLIKDYPEIKTGLFNGQKFTLNLIDSSINPDGIKTWFKYGEYVNKNASADSTLWQATSYSTTKNSVVYQQMNGCLSKRNGLLGSVSTNATIYEVGAPEWSATQKSLSFKVASPTNDSSGFRNSGNYELVVREDIAKCLWGSSITSAKAIIQIIDETGKTQISTTTFTTKKGYLYFKASGFHFSSPKILVSFAKNSATSITCKKGSITKKVTGLSPKCPKGYSKI